MNNRRVTGVAFDAAQVVQILAPDAETPVADFGRLLDASSIDFVILKPGDHQHGITFDATVAATILARHTESVGLVVGANPLLDHPYNLARRLSSLDHISNGRAGWFVMQPEPTTQSWSACSDLDNPVVVADAITVVRELWESWPRDTIIGDLTTGVFAESDRIVYIDHVGAHNVSGPLNVPEPPQSKVPVFWTPGGKGQHDLVLPMADVVIGGIGAAEDQLTLTSRRLGEPLDTESGSSGTVLLGTGEPMQLLKAALSYVDCRPHVAARAPLRERLGLPTPQRLLHHPRRVFETSRPR